MEEAADAYNLHLIKTTKQQQAQSGLTTEDVADHFLNWVYLSYDEIQTPNYSPSYINDMLSLPINDPIIQNLDLPSSGLNSETQRVLGFWLGKLAMDGIVSRGPAGGIQEWSLIASHQTYMQGQPIHFVDPTNM